MQNSTSVQVGPSWHGFANIKHLVIFGDSYSDVGYSWRRSKHPTKEQPLGVEFPGDTWNEPELPNWVGYLIKECSPDHSMLVYDYAVGGDRVTGVSSQVQKGFLPLAGGKPEWAPWSETDTLFITWVGINDCAFTRKYHERILSCHEELFEQQELLYNAGARNFLFIDLPPIQRSPAVSSSNPGKADTVYEHWNTYLREAVTRFSATHPDITVMLFSSHDTFTRVLDDPAKFGFGQKDSKKRGGTIWFDQLHPTSKMHKEVALDIATFLKAQPGYPTTTPREQTVDCSVSV